MLADRELVRVSVHGIEEAHLAHYHWCTPSSRCCICCALRAQRMPSQPRRRGSSSSSRPVMQAYVGLQTVFIFLFAIVAHQAHAHGTAQSIRTRQQAMVTMWVINPQRPHRVLPYRGQPSTTLTSGSTNRRRRDGTIGVTCIRVRGVGGSRRVYSSATMLRWARRTQRTRSASFSPSVV